MGAAVRPFVDSDPRGESWFSYPAGSPQGFSLDLPARNRDQSTPTTANCDAVSNRDLITARASRGEESRSVVASSFQHRLQSFDRFRDFHFAIVQTLKDERHNSRVRVRCFQNDLVFC